MDGVVPTLTIDVDPRAEVDNPHRKRGRIRLKPRSGRQHGEMERMDGLLEEASFPPLPRGSTIIQFTRPCTLFAQS